MGKYGSSRLLAQHSSPEKVVEQVYSKYSSRVLLLLATRMTCSLVNVTATKHVASLSSYPVHRRLWARQRAHKRHFHAPALSPAAGRQTTGLAINKTSLQIHRLFLFWQISL